MLSDSRFALRRAVSSFDFNLDERELESALAQVENMATVTSLYDHKGGESATEDGGFRIVDLIADPKSFSPSKSIELEEKKRLLAQAISELPEQERIVITLYYYEGMLLKQIGEVFNITESRVSQIRSHALMLLKVKMRQMK